MVKRDVFDFSVNKNGEPEVINKTENTIYFAFPINKKRLWYVPPNETVALKGRSKAETQRVINCLINEEYTLFDKFVIGDKVIN